MNARPPPVPMPKSPVESFRELLAMNPDERQRTVTLTKPFYMGRHAVTQAQWKKVMGNNPSSFNDAGDDAPV